MFASIQDLEFVQGQSRDVPDRELVLNNNNLQIVNEYKSLGLVFNEHLDISKIPLV